MEKKYLDEILSNKFGKAKQDELLKNYTTMKIGGPADVLVMPENQNQIVELLKYTKNNSIPLTIIGKGSNLLIRDKGIRGVVVVLRENFSNISVNENVVKAQAGALLRDVAKVSFENELKGMEAVSGIPGSIGGAVIMNAGAYGTEMKDIIKSVRAIDRDGNILEFKNEEMNFSYRNSIAEERNLIVIEAEFELDKGDKEIIYKNFEEFDLKRKSKQPLEKNSAGSTFKRPEGYYASKLIDDTGLRGFTVGNAQVSEKHTGFLINIDDSTCENMLELISQVQEKVFEKYGVMLEREVKLIGEE